MNRFDKVSSLTCLMASIAIIVGSSAYSFGTASQPGPAFLPLWCGAIIAALSLIVFIKAVLKDKIKAIEKKESSFLTPRWPKLLATLIILFIYAFLLELFGFLMMAFISMLLMLKVVESTKWRTAVIEAAAAAIFSYSIFALWLRVQLPKGFWTTLF